MLAALAAVLFGAATPASKWLLAELHPFALAGLLYLGAALGMVPIVARERGRARLPRAQRARLAGAIVFGGVLGPLLLLSGLRQTAATSVSLLLHLELVFTAALGAALFREHLGRAGWLGVASGVAAGAVLSGAGGWPGATAAALVAAACACWAIDNHCTALLDGITPARGTLWKGAAAGTTNLGVAALAASLDAPPATALAALAVGALCYGASIALYVSAAQALGATRAQVVFASAPFAGAALSCAWLGEPLGPAHAAAAGLLALSLAALAASRHAHAHVHEAQEHVHAHRHDDGHHDHAHPGLAPETWHIHAHRHDSVSHAHPHWPDLHHRHAHPARSARAPT